MKLKNIVPWGRTFLEYKMMFKLSKEDLATNILGCGDGPASFNSELTAMGGNVISVDPSYVFSKEEIALRIEDVVEEVMSEVRKNIDNFVWKNIQNTEHLYELRMGAMRQFLTDYMLGKEEGRYIKASLPKLPFKNKEFDLALSSHFLFLYSEHLDEIFHRKAIEEMLRVAREVRIFPLVTLEGKKSTYLNAIITFFENLGYTATIEVTGYEFQKAGNEMLRIERK